MPWGLTNSGFAYNAETLSTNAQPRWLSTPEILKKWGDTPLETIRSAAEHGNPTAEHYLGYCYAEGLHVTQNTAWAVSWYERAGNSGYMPSLNNLGFLYVSGKVVPQDLPKGISYYRRAADAGFSQAQANLGFLYRDGVGVPLDFEEALKWFRLAADQGHATAMVEVGRRYRFGQGVTKDRVTARIWFQKAADTGDSLGDYNLGMLFEEQGALEQATLLYRQAADHGQADAMVALYFIYWRGRGVDSDKQEAKRWLTKGAETGSAYAQCLLGYRCENPTWEGKVLPPIDMPTALQWYRKSADQNWSGGLYHLGLCYLSGLGLEKDEAQGLELIRRASDQNHAYAMQELADLYARGIGEPRNEQDRPMALLERVTKSKADNIESAIEKAYGEIIKRYEYGVGTQKDLVNAVEWYCRAALSGVDGYNLKNKFEIGPHRNAQGGGHFSSDRYIPPLVSEHVLKIERNDRFLHALSCYLKAATINDSKSMVWIGSLFGSGQGVPKDPVRAWLWFTLAAQNGDSGARAQADALEAQFTSEQLNAAKQQLADVTEQLHQVGTALGHGAERRNDEGR